jgi:hypothetical protein
MLAIISNGTCWFFSLCLTHSPYKRITFHKGPQPPPPLQWFHNSNESKYCLRIQPHTANDNLEGSLSGQMGSLAKFFYIGQRVVSSEHDMDRLPIYYVQWSVSAASSWALPLPALCYLLWLPHNNYHKYDEYRVFPSPLFLESVVTHITPPPTIAVAVHSVNNNIGGSCTNVFLLYSTSILVAITLVTLAVNVCHIPFIHHKRAHKYA